MLRIPNDDPFVRLLVGNVAIGTRQLFVAIADGKVFHYYAPYYALRSVRDICRLRLVRLARGQDFRFFLLWLFDFFLLTVVAFTHNKLLVSLVAMRVAMRAKSATANSIQ